MKPLLRTTLVALLAGFAVATTNAADTEHAAKANLIFIFSNDHPRQTNLGAFANTPHHCRT